MHTPGPWKIEEHSGYTRIVGANGKVILDTDSDDANTRLIAAAPELLAACKDLLWQFNDRIADPQDSELETVKMAEQAIAHAEGKNK